MRSGSTSTATGAWISSPPANGCRIQFYRNDGKRLQNVTASTRLPPLRGWWFSLAAGDFDNDGRPDLVAGNLGLNYTYTTSKDSRFGVYAADFTGHRTTDVVLTQEIDGTEYPFAGLAPLGRADLPHRDSVPDVRVVRRKRQYASCSVRSQLQKAIHYQADTFASVYLHNDGNGTFSASPLPTLAQIAPIKAIVRPRRGRRRPSRSDRGGEPLRRRAEHAEGGCG